VEQNGRAQVIGDAFCLRLGCVLTCVGYDEDTQGGKGTQPGQLGINILCEVTMFVESQEARLKFGNDFVVIWRSWAIALPKLHHGNQHLAKRQKLRYIVDGDRGKEAGFEESV